MPYKRPTFSRARRRATRKRYMIIGGCALAALAVLIVAVVLLRGGHGGDRPVDVPAETVVPTPLAMPDDIAAPDEDDGEEAPAAQSGDSDIDAMLSGNGAASTKTAAPESTPIPETYAARAATRPTPTAEGFRPVFSQANTDEKIVAITVDDCFQAENLQKIVDCAIENNGKLTIFPIGKNAIRDSVAPTLKKAWENGFELENHTYTHNGLYALTDEELATEVGKQALALSYILGVEYTPHFLRPKGGDARRDQRMQQYILQNGYYGVAHWSASGAASRETIAKHLEPGTIYLFHCTDKDRDKLLDFIPWAVSKGYQLVTLNEMFGYPPNETTPLTTPIAQHTIQPLQPYERVYTTLKDTTYSYYAFELQQKLIELGYMKGKPDGVYAKGCADAVKKYQKDHGLKVTGEADPALLKELLG